MNRLRAIPLVFCLLSVASAVAEDRRPASLTIMALNTELLRDGVAPKEGSSQVSFRGSTRRQKLTSTWQRSPTSLGAATPTSFA